MGGKFILRLGGDVCGYKTGTFFYIGRKVAAYRKRQGFTQLQLAQAIHRSRSTIYRIEKGIYNQNISLSILLDIADALRIHVTDLFPK